MNENTDTEGKTIFAMWFWFLTCIYYAISVLNWKGSGMGGRQDCSCGENIFYSSSSNLHQYVAMITIFSIAFAVSPRNIPVALLYTKHFTYLGFFTLGFTI